VRGLVARVVRDQSADNLPVTFYSIHWTILCCCSS
jgi:hypothetical protein